jgi:hypothetical protein
MEMQKKQEKYDKRIIGPTTNNSMMEIAKYMLHAATCHSTFWHLHEQPWK